MTRRWLRVCSVLLIVAAGLALWRAWQPSTATPEPGRWLPIQAQLLERRLGVVGRIQAARQITVAAPFEGMVEALLVSTGERVAAGQSLAILGTVQLDIQLRQAEAELLTRRRASSSTHSRTRWHLVYDWG